MITSGNTRHALPLLASLLFLTLSAATAAPPPGSNSGLKPVPLPAAPAPVVPPPGERKLTLSFDKAPIADALKQIFQAEGLSYTMDGDVAGAVTAHVNDAAFKPALAAVLNASGTPLMYTVEDGVYRIQTDDGAPSAPSEADVWSNIVLANAKPSEILAALGRAQRWDGTKQAPASLIDGIQTIIPNDTGHDLIVSGTAESIAELRRLVHMLDGKPAATPAGAPSSGDPPKPDNAPPPSLQKPSPAWMKAYRAQTIYVDGAVNKPGRYALRCKCTLAAAIAIAGGLKPTAKQVLLNPESPPGNRPVVYTLGVWGSSAVLRKAVIFPGDEIVVAAVTAVR